MNRRHLLAGGAALAASAAASTGSSAGQQTAATGGREYYLIRKYKLSSGPQAAVAGKYFQEALLPALGRMGIGPVGVMSVTYGPETPTTFVIIPSSNLTQLTQLDLLLARDEAFTKAAAPFWAPAATAPTFDRVYSSLSVAFEGFPKLIAPAKGPRILQLRTYESPSPAAHIRKVEMFHSGEFDIFAKTGSTNVFFADDLVGGRGPSLTYMLAHKDMAALEANWKAFAADPAWQKLSHDPKFASEPIVSSIDNLILTPAPYSQI
ncbi:MAG: NIPSNAP family protein [Janthinobacterium lividum]